MEGFDVDHVPDVNTVGIGENATRDIRIAQLLKSKIGPAEVVVVTITAPDNKAGKSRLLGGLKSIPGILDGERLLRGDA